ncbi:MAG: hypothetical protein JSW12_09610 [Deltaproteobacteria bacterium]|nr:MAG: hypothetical protein JSW12_09610 [Deltaproteobacteria bacterium]
MKKAFIQLFIFSLALFYFYEPALSEQGITIEPQSSASRILYQAKQILSNLKSTHYSHKTDVNENSGSYILDCSALVCYILGRAAPGSLASIPVDPTHRHARAKNFYDTFSNAPTTSAKNGWQRIVRLMDAEPGDLIAWRKDPVPQKGNTGHIVIVLEKPVKEKDGAIRIIALDSSRSGHAQGTRKKGDSGVGVGIMWFRVDEAGAPIALHWSNRKRKPETYPIVIGRAIDIPYR